MNAKKLIGLLIVVGIIAVGGIMATKQPAPKGTQETIDIAESEASATDAEAATIMEEATSLIDSQWALSQAPLSTDYVKGNPDASVVVIEYASLTCPHCAQFFNKQFPTIKEKYIDTGKIRFILRQFPLNEPALKAAVLVDCIGEKEGADRYYTFNHVLFDAQSKWAFDAFPM